MASFDDFPSVRGILQEKSSLAKKSRFGVGGPAEILFIPEDMDDLQLFLDDISPKFPITILGAMSNVLIRSGGISGVVIMLDNWFKKIFVEDEILEVGAAVSCSELSTIAIDSDLGGFEFLMGLPGSIGGALKMNAGCYGSEIFNVLVEFEAIAKNGQIKWFKANELNFCYRYSGIPDDLIITRAWFRGIPNVDYIISKKTSEILKKRLDSQPLDKKSCGSTFKNPEGKKAWELIHAAGCRGMKVGGAVVSEKHCNFIINTGNATPEDIENLGLKVIDRVRQTSGVTLDWEIIRIGHSIQI
ncbi:MAG: UDP-N-acetylmuramate dehydrogenase [Holosporaceae bacterium]|jgi:UDP-N-acetylmuramate dehydrogenase|nr:UDP-N-acetylmuramate dehydrogenase [Holosporaceae bacterium]